MDLPGRTAQICDTPARRAFMAKVGEKGWLGMTWPKEYGGSEQDGVYEYLLNEALARRGAPQIGKGVGIIGKTLIRPGSDKLKREFLPKILRNEVEFAIGYSEPNAGSDAASMQLRATRDGDGWRLNGQKTWTTSAHFAEWYWVGARTDPDAPKHHGITLFLVPLDDPGLTIRPIWTMGDERTNEVFFDDVFVHDDYVVGEVNKGFQYIAQALDLERFTMFTYSQIDERIKLLVERPHRHRDGKPLKDDPVVRSASPGSSPRARSPACSACASCTSPCAASTRRGRRPPSTSSTPPSCPSGWPTPRWTSPGRARSSGWGPRRRRWPGGPSRPTATRSSTRSAAAPRRCRRTSSPPASWACPGTSEAAVSEGPLAGTTVLDLSTVGPATRCSRLLADYGARVVKVGPPPRAGATPLVPPFHAYSGQRGLERVQIDLRSERPGRLPAAGGGRRRRAQSFRPASSTASASATRPSGR